MITETLMISLIFAFQPVQGCLYKSAREDKSHLSSVAELCKLSISHLLAKMSVVNERKEMGCDIQRMLQKLYGKFTVSIMSK